MRTQILELDETLTAFTAGGRSILTPGIPTDFPLINLFLHVRGRLRVTADGTAIAIEAPKNIIERIRIFGNHRSRGHLELLHLEGVDLFHHAWFYNSVEPQNLNGGLAFVVGEYDFETWYKIPWALPLTDPRGRFHTILDAPAFNSLQAEITWATSADFVVGGTTALTAFNSTTGVPSVDLHREIPLLGSLATKFKPRTVIRSYESLAFNSVALVGGLITDRIPVGNLLRSIMIKVGTRSAESGRWATVSDAILTQLRLMESAKKLHRNYVWNSLKQINRDEFRFQTSPLGYAMIEFVKEGNLNDAFITVDFAARNKVLKLTGDLTSTSDARINVIYTEILLDR